MECPNCQLQQRSFVCENCIRKDVKQYHQQTSRLVLERDAAVAKATAELDSGISTARIHRADRLSMERQVADLTDALAKLRKSNDQARQRLQTLRNTLAERRQTLTAARSLSISPISPVSPPVLSAYSSLSSLAAAIARARVGLVQELVQVFGVSHDISHWSIGTLVLPLPGDMRRYPPNHINAVLTLTVHFINLLAFYLGVKLPFTVTWAKARLGVGTPFISPIKGIGGDQGGWAKWEGKHPLHVSTNVSETSRSPNPSSPFTSITLPSINTGTDADQDSASSSDVPGSPLDSTSTETDASMILQTLNRKSAISFTTALAMLLYNVAYLAYTQHVNIPLHQVAAGDVLANLWAVCFASPGLGKYSHETTTSLTPNPCSFPLPRLPSPIRPIPHSQVFTLEFGQLLQAMSRPPPRTPATVSIPTSSTSPIASSPAVKHRPSDTAGGSQPKQRRPSQVSLAKDIIKRRDKTKLGPGSVLEGQVFLEDEEDEWDLV